MRTHEESMKDRFTEEQIAKIKAKAKRNFPEFLRKAEREAPAVRFENERRRQSR